MKNILVLTYWSYKESLIQAYTLPYLKIILNSLPDNSRIHLFTLEKKSYQLSQKEKSILQNTLSNQGISLISAYYRPYGILMLFSWIYTILKLTFFCKRKKFDYIHAWCTPAGAAGFLISKLTGIPLIIDSYEPHADAMVEVGTWGKNSMAYKILSYLEKKQTSHAKSIIGLTSATPNYIHDRFGIELKRYYLKPACVDLDQFNPFMKKDQYLVKHLVLEDHVICVYAGKIGGIYLEKEIFDFFKVCLDFFEGKFIALILSDADEKTIHTLAQNSNFPLSKIRLFNVEHAQIQKYLLFADFALNPVKPVPSKRYCTSIKDGEYWATGLPVVITPNIADDSVIIKTTNSGAIIQQLNEAGYLEAVEIIQSMLNNVSRSALKKRIRKLAEKYRNYSIAQKVYQEIYSNEMS